MSVHQSQRVSRNYTIELQFEITRNISNIQVKIILFNNMGCEAFICKTYKNQIVNDKYM